MTLEQGIIRGLMVVLLLAGLPLFAKAEESALLWEATSVRPEWQLVVSDSQSHLEKTASGIILKTVGESYLTYPLAFGYGDYPYLEIALASNSPLELSVIPNISSTARYTFELQERISPSAVPATRRFSLRVPEFKKVTDFAIKIKSARPAEVAIKSIALSPGSFFDQLTQPVKDYLRVAPYAEYTVNLFPAPRVWGRAAFVYFLPLFAVICFLYLLSPKYRRLALVGFLVLWLMTDLRMNYEFLSYQLADYQTWVRPAGREKMFRTQGDLYTFIDWLNRVLPAGVSSVHFYFPEDPYLKGIVQYYLYPVRLYPPTQPAAAEVVYRRSDIRYDPPSGQLVREGKPLTAPGRLVASFDPDSFIFLPQ